MTIITGVLVLGLWLPSRGAASITAFSALYGLFSGGTLYKLSVANSMAHADISRCLCVFASFIYLKYISSREAGCTFGVCVHRRGPRKYCWDPDSWHIRAHQ